MLVVNVSAGENRLNGSLTTKFLEKAGIWGKEPCAVEGCSKDFEVGIRVQGGDVGEDRKFIIGVCEKCSHLSGPFSIREDAKKVFDI